MNHYRYMSTTSEKFTPLFDNAPDPIEPPGAGWELCGQCAVMADCWVRLVWSWRQVAFVTPDQDDT